MTVSLSFSISGDTGRSLPQPPTPTAPPTGSALVDPAFSPPIIHVGRSAALCRAQPAGPLPLSPALSPEGLSATEPHPGPTFPPVRIYKRRAVRRPTWYWIVYIGDAGELLCDELGRPRRFRSTRTARAAGIRVLRDRQRTNEEETA
ncbi:hypothetical protein [Methylocaldum gracile]|jgi:hypothetical protein